MDEKVLLAVIRRIDDLERRVMAKIDNLNAFKYKVIGGILVAGFIVELMRK